MSLLSRGHHLYRLRVWQRGWWVACVAILMCHAGLSAQPTDLRFRHLSLEDGLSQTTVHDIVQDRDGFMWIGTQDGLNRYDGYAFTVFKHQLSDSTSLSDNEVRALHEDRNGTLWIGTFGGGINRLDAERTTFHHYRHDATTPGSLCDDQVRVIHEDQHGQLWIGTERGLDRFDPESDHFTHVTLRPDSIRARILALETDYEGILWIGTDHGLFKRDPATGDITLYRHHPNDSSSLSAGEVWAILEDQAHQLWIGTDNGLDLLDQSTGHFSHHRHDPDDPHSLSSDSIWTLFLDSEGTLWIGTYGGGINRFDGERFLHYQHVPADPGSVSSNRIRSLYEDRSGVLWVGSLDGLDFSNRAGERFGRYRHRTTDPHSVSDGSIWAFQDDPSGKVWIGTDTGLDQFNPATGVSTHWRHDANDDSTLLNDRVWALAFTPPDNLWIGTDGGLDRLNLTTKRFTHYRHDPSDANSLGADRVWALHTDSSGIVWIGTDGGGMDRLDSRTGRFEHFRNDPSDPGSISEDRVRAFLRDREGRLWVGTYGKGLNRYIPERNQFVVYRHDILRPGSLNNDRIRGLYESPDGQLWIGTDGGGLNRLPIRPPPDPAQATFFHFTEEDGLPNNTVYGILPDDEKNLWLSTNKGLVRYNPPTGQFSIYEIHDGLQSDEFNGGAYLRTREGQFYFGGISGFNTFDPKHIKPGTYVPPIVFTDFKVLNHSIPITSPLDVSKEITLSYKDYVISVAFASLDYRAPEKNVFSYKLDGFNREWVDIGSKHDVTFTNLEPGRYALRVRGMNSEGVWNQGGATLRLVVTPPFWKRWWVQMLGLLTLVGLLWKGHLRRTRRIEEHNRELQAEISRRRQVEEERESFVRELENRNAELEQFTYTVSHDLKSPLVTIKGFLDLLEKDLLADDQEHLQRDIHHIGTAADQMQQLLSELLELSRTGRVVNPSEVISLSDLAHEALNQIHGEVSSVNVRVSIAPDMPSVLGDRIRLREVFQNLIENAVKFRGDHPEPAVEIDAAIEGDEVVCRVRDNGIGIAPRFHDKVFGLFERLGSETEGTGIGLALVKRIIEVHHGRIWVESEGEGHGTTFAFSLPVFDDAAGAPA